MLVFNKVNVWIAGVHVLRNVTFDLRAGATAALIGRNGAGKTTIARTIMGFTDTSRRASGWPASISARSRRTNGRGWGSAMRRKTGGCSRPSPSRKTSCCRPASPSSTAPKPSAGSIAPTPCCRNSPTLKARPAGSLSGGQGKMAALGRALMLGTRLVILDEPFQGLAPVLAQRYAEALRRLRAQDADITLLITESNPKLLETFADTTHHDRARRDRSGQPGGVTTARPHKTARASPARSGRDADRRRAECPDASERTG